MTATYSTATTLLVAIDISKHRHAVLIGIPGKKRRRKCAFGVGRQLHQWITFLPASGTFAP